MKRALLDLLVCPCCEGALTCHVHSEAAVDEIIEGLLLCAQCSRWYPITGQLPELLPDHLRDADRDVELFKRSAAELTPAQRAVHEQFRPGAGAGSDDGAHHKTAEIRIKTRIHDEKDFFGPGYSAPFNPHNTEFSLYLVHLFGAVAPLLECRTGDVVIDSGCGYSWTTEWLHRSGINAVGVDICRTYLDIAIERLGANRPHLVVADVENLPFRRSCADAILAYESFHHIPDRPRAMQGYSRILKDGGRVVLAEPGAAHEDAPVSIEVMAKYGILEKGMELADVNAYIAGTAFGAPEQIFMVQAQHRDLAKKVVEIARVNSPVEGNIFRLRKDGSRAAAALPPQGEEAGGKVDVQPSAASFDDIVVLATEAPRLREQLGSVSRQLVDTQLALAEAKDRIFHMERSLFWRMRELWQSARGADRPPKGPVPAAGKSDR